VAQRIAGIAFLTVDGDQLALRGNFTVSPSPVERTMIAGQDGVHGYQELPRVPYIEGDLSTVPGLSLETLLTETDSTVVAQLANGMQYVLTSATCKGGFENNTRDGQVRVRWEGLTCEEMALGGT
jgi:hypothetical protein